MGVLPFPWLLLVLTGYTALGWQLAGWPLSPHATLMVSLGLAVALPLVIALLKWLFSLFLVLFLAGLLSLAVWPLLTVAWELVALWVTLVVLVTSFQLVAKTVRKLSLALVLTAAASLGLSLGLLGRFAWQALQTLWGLWQMS